MRHPTPRSGWHAALKTAWLAAALMLFMGVSDNNACAPDPGDEGECTLAADCVGRPAPSDCAGQWSCEANACVFTCDQPEPQGCYGDQDCADGLVCNAAEVCLSPPGCEPGQPCPDVCYGFCVEPEPDPEPTGCYSDQDCPSGQHCSVSDGDCGPPPGCGGGMTCPAVCYGECVDDQPETCDSDDDCGPGMICGCADMPYAADADGASGAAEMPCLPQCVPDPSVEPCGSDYECAPGQVCVDGVCTGEAGCYSDDDCAADEFCNFDVDTCGGWSGPNGLVACMGVCAPREEPWQCESDDDCAEGEYCGCQPWLDDNGDGVPEGDVWCEPTCLPKDPTPPGCDSDDDCAYNEYCGCGPGPYAEPNGIMCFLQCLPKPYECSTDADCDGGHCNIEVCEDWAYDPVPCEPGDEACGQMPPPPEPQCYGYCEEDPNEFECSSDADCGAGERCELVVCEAWAGPACDPDEDADCDPAMIPQPEPQCYGYCVEDPQPPEYECSSDADCEGEAVCELVVCSGGAAMPCYDEDGDGMCDPPDGGQCWGFCVEPPPAQCESDDDCEAGEVCKFEQCPLGPCWYDEETGESWCPPCVGECVPAGGDSCSDNADCLPGQYCEIESCHEECWDCVPGQDCGGGCQAVCEGTCRDMEWPQECESNADCDEGERCECTPNPACPECDVCFMQCVPDEEPPPPGECTADYQCGAGQHCETVCPPCACPADGDCPWCECFGICVDNPEPPYPSCDDDGSCPDGSSCQCMPDPNCPVCDVCLFQCVPDTPPAECEKDADCGEGYYCEQGPCPFFMPCGPDGCPGCGGVCKEKETPNPCMVTGCSGQVCAAEPVFTTCEWQPQYACYQLAECGLNPDGSCGWQANDEFTQCMQDSSGF